MIETYTSKKRWQQMEKRVADLEHKSQGQDSTSLSLMKDAFQFSVHQDEKLPILQADLKFSGLESGGMKKKELLYNSFCISRNNFAITSIALLVRMVTNFSEQEEIEWM